MKNGRAVTVVDDSCDAALPGGPDDIERRRLGAELEPDPADAELLEEERVLLVQGSGFNWPQPDHFRLVFLPHEDDLRDAIGRVARFLENYRKRHGT